MNSLQTRRILRYAEYGLLVFIIGLLVLFLLNRVETLHKNAERMAVMGEINALRASVVSAQNSPKDVSLKNLSRMNPLRILQTPPKNYLGPVENLQEREIPPGSWYFFTKESLLIYKCHYAHDFSFTQEPTRSLRLALESPDEITQKPGLAVLACDMNICLTSR